MSGLFEKDLRIIMQRKKVFIIFVLLAVFIGYSQVSPEFVVTFVMYFLNAMSNGVSFSIDITG